MCKWHVLPCCARLAMQWGYSASFVSLSPLYVRKLIRWSHFDNHFARRNYIALDSIYTENPSGSHINDVTSVLDAREVSPCWCYVCHILMAFFKMYLLITVLVLCLPYSSGFFKYLFLTALVLCLPYSNDFVNVLYNKTVLVLRVFAMFQWLLMYSLMLCSCKHCWLKRT